MQVVQLAAGQHAHDRQVHRLRDVPRHLLVIAGDDLELHAAFRQIDDDLLHIGLWRIEEEQKADEGEVVFIGARIGFGRPSTVFVATPSTRKPLALHSLYRCSISARLVASSGSVSLPSLYALTDAQDVVQGPLGDEGALALGHRQ